MSSARILDHGNGDPVLLLNGLGADAASWDPLVPRLPHLRTIRYDDPGTGNIPWRGESPTIRGRARRAVHVLDEVGVDCADVVGYSLGGAVALQLAHDSPDRVRRLVLLATSPGLGGAPPRLGAGLALANPLRFASRRLFLSLTPILLGGETGHDKDLLRRYADLRLARPPGASAYLAQLAAAATWTSLPWLRRIPHLAVVACGDADPLTRPGNTRLLARLLPHARAEIVPGAGHLLVHERPDLVARLITEFLKE